jgi:hypothetical protein
VPKAPRPIRPHPTDATAALVELTRGYWALIDAADAAEIGRFNWCSVTCGKGVYAQRRRANAEGGGKEYLHHRIGILAGLRMTGDVDHRDGNPLDCRRRNLRDATFCQNAQNAGLNQKNTSGVKGVHWNADTKKWKVEICAGNHSNYLGLYADKTEAERVAIASRAALHGEFANHGRRPS